MSSNLPYQKRSAVLGKIGNKTVHLDAEDQVLSMHILGLPGMGKSKFMEALIRQDIYNGRGLCLIDPHGKLVEDILLWLPTQQRLFDKLRAAGKLTVLEPGSGKWAFSFNPFGKKHDSPAERSYYADSLVKVMTQIWGREVYEQPTIRNNLFALFYVLLQKGLTLSESRHFLSSHDNEVRTQLTQDIDNIIVQDRWNELNSCNKREYHEQFVGPANRLHGFLSSSVLYNIFDEPKHIDFRSAMDEGKIILVNMASQSRFSASDGDVLAGLFINEIYEEALKRTTRNPRPFGLYIDECHRYLTDDIAHILSECRKFGVSVALAHQYLGQLKEKSTKLFEGIMQAAQTKVVFGLSDMEDCKRLSENLFYFDPEAVKQYGFEVQRQAREENVSHTVGSSRSTNRSSGSGESSGYQHSESSQNTNSRMKASSSAVIDSFGISQTDSWGVSEGISMNDAGDFVFSASTGDRFGGGTGVSEARSYAEGNSEAEGHSKSKGFSTGKTQSFSVTQGQGEGETQSESTTTGYQYVPVYVRVPKIYRSVEEQVYICAQAIKNLGKREAFVRMPGQQCALKIRIANVAPPTIRKSGRPVPNDALPLIVDFLSSESDDVYSLEEKLSKLADSTTEEENPYDDPYEVL